MVSAALRALRFRVSNFRRVAMPVLTSSVLAKRLRVGMATVAMLTIVCLPAQNASAQATGTFGGNVSVGTFTNVVSAQMNDKHNVLALDNSSASYFADDAELLTGSAYVQTQVTALIISTGVPSVMIDAVNDVTYCYYNSGSTRIDQKIYAGSATWGANNNIYTPGSATSVCASDAKGEVYQVVGDGTLTTAVPNSGTYAVTLVSGTPAGVVGVAVGFGGNILLSATGGTYVGTISSAGAWAGSLVTTHKFYQYAAYQDMNGVIYLEDATTQVGYSFTQMGSSYTQAAWTKPFGVTAVAYSYNSTGSLMVASATAVNVQFAGSLTFPSTAVGAASQVEELVFKFTAGGTLGSLTLTTPSGATDFVDAGTGTCTTNGSSHTYAAGDLCTVDVKFTPSIAGSRTGTVTMLDSQNNFMASAPLSGTGASSVTAAPAANSFGSVAVGSTSSQLTVTFAFSGVSSTVGSVKILTGGAAGQDFAAPSSDTSTTLCKAQTYAPGATCTADLTFAPTAPGVRKGAVVLTDSTGKTLATAYVSGVGTGAQAVFHGAGKIVAGGPTGLPIPPCAGATDSIGSGCTGTSAFVYAPRHIATDGNGNVYWAEYFNQVIRKLNPATGIVTTVAGTPQTTGYSGDYGPATSALLNYPVGVTIDGAGNIVIADSGNNVIRRVDAQTGIITTVAGNGTRGVNVGDGGPATSAELSLPPNVMVDGAGNIIFPDQFGTIRRVDAVTGIITVIAGKAGGTGCSNTTFATTCGDGGQATSAGFADLKDVQMDAAGNLYIVDPGTYRIRKVTASTGVITTVVGNGTASLASDGALATSGGTVALNSVTIDPAGNIIYGDYGAGDARRVDATTGVVTTIVGGQSGYGGSVEGVAFDATGNLYFTDDVYDVKELPAGASMSHTFASANIGSTSSDSPYTFTFENFGNATLSYNTPGVGATNPVLAGAGAASYSISNSSTCPQLTNSSSAQTLAAGKNCTYVVSYTPQTTTNVATLTTTDTSLNKTAATQVLTLGGSGISPHAATLGAVQVSPASSTYTTSQAVSLSVSLTFNSSTPTGAVTFSLNSVNYAATCGTTSPATCTASVPAATIAALSVNSYSVGVALAADTTYSAASGTSSTFAITAATPTLGTVIVPMSTVSYGSNTAEVLTASLTYVGAAPSGAVTFTLNGVSYTAVCTGAISPQTCTATVPAATVAALSISSGYPVGVSIAAAGNYTTATGTNGTLVVTAATPTLGTVTATPGTEPYGTSAAVVLSVPLSYLGASAPTGATSFAFNGVNYPASCTGSSSPQTCIATVPAATVAALPVSTGYSATVSIAAAGNYATASGTAGKLVITAIAPTVATVSSVTTPLGSKTGVTVTVNESGTGGVAVGVVTFSTAGGIGGTFAPTTCTLVAGTCTTTYTPTGSAGLNTYANDIIATIAANGNYAQAVATSNFVVSSVAPSVATVSAVTTTYGSTTAVTVTATESGTAGVVTGGVVTFGLAGGVSGSFSLATCTLSATGTCTTTYIPTGTQTAGTYVGDITANFAQVGSYLAASGVSTLTVTPAAQVITLTAQTTPVTYSPTPIVDTLSAATFGASGNPVVFSITTGAAFGTLSGTNNSTLTITGAGTIIITATQAASTNYAAATPVTQTIVVNPAPQAITFVQGAVTMGQPATLSATGGASGNAVTFAVTSTAGGGGATINGSVLTPVSPGVVTVTASQAASANYAAAPNVTQTFAVLQAAPALKLTLSTTPVLIGSPVTFSATLTAVGVTPTAGDAVTFYDGTTSLGTVTLTGGVASLTVTLPVGTHVVTAYFGGDVNLLPLTSASVTELVEDFTLNISAVGGNSQTVVPGGSTNFNFLLAMTNGAPFPLGVSLTATGGPAGGVITLSPTTLAAGSGATAVTLTVKTPAQTASMHGTPIGKELAPIALALLVLPFWLRRKAGRLSRAMSVALLLMISAGALASLAGCATGVGFFSQGPTVSQIIVTATSGTQTRTSTVTLTVE